jgi:1,4-alpha-glucan branching enzyme
MAPGALALVLHAHLPYVRSADPGSLEQDWYYQALSECYLPLLDRLEASAADPDQAPRLTVGLSPTLLSLLCDRELAEGFPDWLGQRRRLLELAPTDRGDAAVDLDRRLAGCLRSWQGCGGDVLARFRALEQQGVLDLLTCAATHGYLPLLRDVPEAVRGQLRTAVREHRRLLGTHPLGIWLPECAYFEDLDRELAATGLRYAVLDGHGLLHARPRPRYGVYAPICSPAGVAFFGRDSSATLPVWSAREGYPGDPVYREFHRDLGWDLSAEQLRTVGIGDRRPLGLKLHRVTARDCPLDRKRPYRPLEARSRVREHASHYLAGRRHELESLSRSMDRPPLLVAPFDAELFGHWWYEGPDFLAELFRQAGAQEIHLTTLRESLGGCPQLQLCQPSPSSWGQGGYHHYWLNEANAWIIPEWHRASAAMVAQVSRGVGSERQRRRLSQAARELLLSQSSDWSFILRAGTTTELARERIHRHLNRFWRLIESLRDETSVDEAWEASVEREDGLFPLVNAADWARRPSAGDA